MHAAPSLPTTWNKELMLQRIHATLTLPLKLEVVSHALGLLTLVT